MSPAEIKKKVEAVLFASGRAVDIEELCSLLHISSQGLVKEAVKELKQELIEKGSSILLIEEGNGWKLTVKDNYVDLVKNVTPHTEIDKAILETLAVIAWRQPVLQSEVIKIRTTQAYEHVAQLVELGFISKEKYGRSFILKPTQKFLEYFDLPSKKAVKELFKDVPELIKQKRLDEQEQEDQAKETEEKGEEDPDKVTDEKVGDLPVYESTEPSASSEEQEAEETKEQAEAGMGEHLGGLEVFEEAQDEPSEESEPTTEEQQEKETPIEEDPSKKALEHTEEVMTELTGEEEKKDEETPEPTTEEQKEEVPEESETTETKEDSEKTDEKQPEERTLNKELEDFAEEDKEKEETEQ